MTATGILLAVAAITIPWPSELRIDITFVSLLIAIWLLWNGIAELLEQP